MRQRRKQSREVVAASENANPTKSAASRAAGTVDAAVVDTVRGSKAAAATMATSDDGLSGLDLGRHWLTLRFRNANVGYYYRRRHQRSFAHITATLVMVLWVNDMLGIDFGVLRTADITVVVAQSLRTLAPFVSAATVSVAWSTGARIYCRLQSRVLHARSDRFCC